MIATGGQPDAPGDGGGDVGEDVAEQVVSDQHVEALRIRNEEHRGRVDVLILRLDVGELGSDRGKRSGPEVAGVRQHVRLVDHGHLTAFASRRPPECIADHALHAVPRIEALFGRDLGRRVFVQKTAGAGIEALGALADHDHVDLTGLDVREGAGGAWPQPGRSQIDVVVEGEPEFQQQATLEDTRWHGRVADGAEQDRVVAR